MNTDLPEAKTSVDDGAFRQQGPTVFIPMRLGRRCGRKVILTPSSPNGTAATGAPCPLPTRQENPLVCAIARGFRLQALMDSGEFDSHSALAHHMGWSRSYTSRLIRLTLLAPDIVDAIVSGREPSGFSLLTLFNSDYPDDWPGQRKALGFPPVAQ